MLVSPPIVSAELRSSPSQAAAMYGASVAVETPSRILRRVLQQEQDAEGLDDLPSLPNVDITGEHSGFDSPAPPTPANKAPRRILSSPALTPDAPSPPVHPSTQSSVITGSSRTVRPGVRSSTSSPSIRSSPSSRVRRTVPSPVIEDDSKEEVDLPEEGEEDSLESSGDSLDASPSHVQLRRGGGNGGVHRRKLPSLSSASSFSAASSGLPSPPSHDYLSSPEKSHRERSVSILSQSMVEAPATEDELTREFELPSEILPSSPFPPAHTPLPNRPQRKSALAQVTPGPDSTSPSDHTSPGDFETPRPAPNSIDAERRKTHVLNTLRMTAVRSAARARIAKGTPFIRRTAAELSDEASESDATSSSQDLTTFQRVNASMPDVGAGAEGEAAGPAGRFNGGKLNAYLHTLNTHLTEENQALAHELEVAQAELERIRDGDEDEDEGSPALIEALRNEVEDLRALRETEIAADAARVDDLLSELEKRDRALHEQEANFNDKMERLEKELTGALPLSAHWSVI